MSKHTLPTISLLSEDSEQAFVRSLHEYGFAALTDHPLDMSRVHQIYTDWQAFFDSNAKFQFQFNRDTQDGYFGLADAESAKGSEIQDFKEYFHFYPSGRCPSDLRADLLTYYHATEDFAKTLLTWVESHSPTQVCDGFLEPLSSMIDASQSSLLRILHYPAVLAGTNLPRASAHEDINLLTILPASNGPGLEILAKNGEWLRIEDRDDQVLVNTGDMLAEASNGYFPSTTHRVASEDSALDADSRMSMPLFLHPRPDVQLSRRYSAGDYLHERLLELGVIDA
ncbi:MAG: 2OG-Fe(II) oxygenase family protein [Pseudomonadales bacterium]|nr:2OG-Fe(II) oxygenase family protein [Pseudomonadales bacterium]